MAKELSIEAKRVVKEADGLHTTDDKVEFLPFSDETRAQIAKSNVHMKPAEVHHALLAGQTVYTSFRRFRLEA